MSYETVRALRRFTNQLIVKAAEDPAPDGLISGQEHVIDPHAPRGVAPAKGAIPNITKPAKPFSMAAYDAAHPAPKSGITDKIMEALGNATKHMSTGANMGHMAGIGGGALAGGLGAYGLAQLLNSGKDEEEKRFPWLSTLAGTAGGGALAAYLMSRGGHPAALPNAAPNTYAAKNPVNVETSQATPVAGLA